MTGFQIPTSRMTATAIRQGEGVFAIFSGRVPAVKSAAPQPPAVQHRELAEKLDRDLATSAQLFGRGEKAAALIHLAFARSRLERFEPAIPAEIATVRSAVTAILEASVLQAMSTSHAEFYAEQAIGLVVHAPMLSATIFKRLGDEGLLPEKYPVRYLLGQLHRLRVQLPKDRQVYHESTLVALDGMDTEDDPVAESLQIIAHAPAYSHADARACLKFAVPRAPAEIAAWLKNKRHDFIRYDADSRLACIAITALPEELPPIALRHLASLRAWLENRLGNATGDELRRTAALTAALDARFEGVVVAA